MLRSKRFWGSRFAAAVAMAAMGLGAGLHPAQAPAQVPEKGFVCQDVNTDDTGAIAVGSPHNTACGTQANASDSTNDSRNLNTSNSAFGFQSNASGSGGANTAIGGVTNDPNAPNVVRATDAHGDKSTNVAIGGGDAHGNSSGNIAIGAGANAVGENGNQDNSNRIAIGASATASGKEAVAIGDHATATDFSVATGGGAKATGFQSTATGAGAMATASLTTATGTGAQATASNSTAIGAFAKATNDGSTAVGVTATANFTNSTAIGTGATTTRDNQMAFGTKTNTYTAAGITSGTSLAAQSGRLQVVTSDAGGNLATDGGAIFGSLNQLQNSINQLQQEDKRLRTGIAMAAAVPHSVVLPGERVAFDVDWANYAGSNAVGFNGAVRLGQFNLLNGEGPVNVQANVGAGFSSDGNNGGRTIAKAGMRFGW